MISLVAVGLLTAACGGTPTAAPSAAPSDSVGTTTVADPQPNPNNPNLSQCGKDTRTITDAQNVRTTIKGVPKRIVTIELSFADDVSLLGLKPVGVGDDNDPTLLIPQIKQRIGAYTSVGTRESPNVAVIAGLKPDLIIADVVGNAKIMSQLRQIAPTVALRSQHTTYQQNLDAAEDVGATLNQCAKMKQVLADHQAKMAALKAQVTKGEHRTFIFSLSSSKNVTVFNDQQYAGTVLEYLGLKGAATDPKEFPAGDSVGVTEETLAELNPDIIFYSNAGDTPTSMIDTWKQNPVFQSTNASKTNSVYHEEQKAWSLTRGLTGAEVIAQDAVSDLYGKH